MNWLISANSKVYDHASSFEHHGFIDWHQSQAKFAVDDNVYIYCTKPIQKIRYKCKVSTINLEFNEIRDDEEYWIDKEHYNNSKTGKFMKLVLIEQVDLEQLSLNNLLSNGLSAAPQGPKKLDGELLNYIENNFDDNLQEDYFPELISEPSAIYEGIKKSSTVNRYERSSIARSLCIEYYGLKCIVCGMDFEKVYGEVGKNFIHIHHLTPIYKIQKEYKINFKEDLRPVCPNCHAMLHRKVNGKYYTIEELSKIYKEHN